MPQKIVLSDVVFTDTSLPLIHPDALLSSGSLFLFDPSHSLGGFSGVPASGVTVPNIAWQEASNILGSGTAATLAGLVASVGMATPAEFVVERTLKGGVHGIITQAGAQATSRAWTVKVPNAVRDYLALHANDHQFYISVASKVTRPGLNTSSAPQSLGHFTNVSAATSNYLFHFGSGNFAPGSGSAKNGGFRIFPANSTEVTAAAGTDRFTNGAVIGATGNAPVGTEVVEFGVGTFGAWNTLNYNKAASRILYRTYIEDLTVSGRTYAQVDALDFAAYQAAFAVGGRFYGDTWSNPAVVLP